MNSKETKQKPKVQKILLSLFAVFIIYSNIWVLLARSPIGGLAQKLPNNKIVADLFDTFSVFSYYETINREMIIKGLPKFSYGAFDEDTWVNLDLGYDYFPHCLGEQQMRLYFSKHYALGDQEFQKACKALANKIKKRFNQKLPYYPMRKVAIGAEVWPRSLKGYRYLKKEDTTSFQPLCVGD